MKKLSFYLVASIFFVSSTVFGQLLPRDPWLTKAQESRAAIKAQICPKFSELKFEKESEIEAAQTTGNLPTETRENIRVLKEHRAHLEWLLKNERKTLEQFVEDYVEADVTIQKVKAGVMRQSELTREQINRIVKNYKTIPGVKLKASYPEILKSWDAMNRALLKQIDPSLEAVEGNEWIARWVSGISETRQIVVEIPKGSAS